MNILLTGSSNILSASLIELFFADGHTLFSCDQLPSSTIAFDAEIRKITHNQTIDLVFLLHGKEIFQSCKHTFQLRKKAEQLLDFTTAIYRHFSSQSRKPTAIIMASSIMIYESNSDQVSVENSSLGHGFAARFYQSMENASEPATNAGIPVTHLRFGEIVDKKNIPALVQLPIIKSVPAIYNDKLRSVNWISLADALKVIRYILEETEITGPINCVSGDTIERSDFIRILCNSFQLSKSFPLPLFLLRTLLGNDLANFYTTSPKAMPLRLMESGFFFDDIALQEYLD